MINVLILCQLKLINDHNDLELMQELPNSIMFGHHQELRQYAKIRIEYDEQLFVNFAELINRILK